MFDYLHGSDRDLVLSFFGAFAHAEFDLKRAGLIKRGKEDASADWDAFARSIRGKFKREQSDAFKAAWKLLLSSPPRKQVARAGVLSLKQESRPERTLDEEYGLLLVRRIRNNLFHGAKFLIGGNQSARDRDLVAAAHAVLGVAIAAGAKNRWRRAA